MGKFVSPQLAEYRKKWKMDKKDNIKQKNKKEENKGDAYERLTSTELLQNKYD